MGTVGVCGEKEACRDDKLDDDCACRAEKGEDELDVWKEDGDGVGGCGDAEGEEDEADLGRRLEVWKEEEVCRVSQRPDKERVGEGNDNGNAD